MVLQRYRQIWVQKFNNPLGLLVLLMVAMPFSYFMAGLELKWSMLAFLALTSITFSLFGFLIGIWADGWEKLSIVPTLVITPLTFLGGSFYSIDMLPGVWKTIALFNPVVYLVSGFRWSFYGVSDVGVPPSCVGIERPGRICRRRFGDRAAL